jgi:aminoglycoside phosphotransferase (APT) family kinase protein
VSAAAYVAPLARRMQSRRELARAARIVPDVLRALPSLESPVESWAVRGAHSTEAGVTALMLGPPDEAPCAVLRIALGHEARRSLTREAATVTALEPDERLLDWRRLLPRVLAEGELDGATYLLQRALQGRNAASLLGAAPARRLQAVAAEAIGVLHERTAVPAVASVATVDRWLSDPVRRVGRAALACRGTRGRHALSRLTAEVRTAVIGRRVQVSRVHGDFWLGNLLVTGDGRSATGIVDWEFAGRHELPALDLLHLVVYTRTLAERRELGGVVRALLEGEPWSAEERTLLGSCDVELLRDERYARAALLLYWLRHLASNLAQSSRYLHSHVWLARNVEPVLRLFETPSPRRSR